MPLVLSATHSGADLVQIGATFDDRKVFVAIQRTQNLFTGQVLQRARRYPPERPGQKYVRTYVLRDGWKSTPSRIVGDNIEATIYNDAVDRKRRSPKEYAKYVYGFDSTGRGQSVWHVGRWPTQGQLFNVESYRQQVQNAIARAFGGQ